MISTRITRLQWVRFAFGLIPAALIAALLAKFFALTFWQGIGLLLGFQLASAVWDMVWSSMWFRVIGRRTLVAEFLDALCARHYPKPAHHNLRSPYDYFCDVRDGSQYPIELRTEAASVATVIFTIHETTIQRGMQLDMAWTDALARYEREFFLDSVK